MTLLGPKGSSSAGLKTAHFLKNWFFRKYVPLVPSIASSGLYPDLNPSRTSLSSLLLGLVRGTAPKNFTVTFLKISKICNKSLLIKIKLCMFYTLFFNKNTFSVVF